MLIRRNFLKSLLAGGYLLNNPDVSTANEFYKFSKSKTTFRDHVNITAMKEKGYGTKSFGPTPCHDEVEENEFLDKISCIYGPEFSEANIDKNFLNGSLASIRVEIGVNKAGINSIIDKHSESLLRNYMQDAYAVFITPGMRVGTDMEAMTAISRIAREMKRLITVAVVPTPCYYKDNSLCLKLDEELSLLKKHVDCCVHVPIAGPVDRETPLSEAFPDSEDAIRLTVQAITDMFFLPGILRFTDYIHLCEFVRVEGRTCAAFGVARGKDRAALAAHRAVCNLKKVSKNTKSLLFSATGDEIAIKESSGAFEIVERKMRNSDIYSHGMSWNPLMKESMRVTLIGTDISDYQS